MRSSYSVQRAAALLGVPRGAVLRWVRTGHLPAATDAAGRLRIEPRDLERVERRATARGSTRTARVHDWPAVDRRTHAVQFYETDHFLEETVARYVATGLRAGETALVIATPAHQAGIERQLQARGIAVETARAEGRYNPLDAAAMLSEVLRDGTPDIDRFAVMCGVQIERLTAAGIRVRVFGELVALLVAEGHHQAALRLETLWSSLQQRHPFALLCAYPAGQFQHQRSARLHDQVCAGHTRVIPTEHYSRLASREEQLRAVARLEQQARSLASEISERERAEAQLREALTAAELAQAMTEAALQSRDDLLTTAAHELRTPLTALMGHAQLALRTINLEGQADPDRVVPALQVINHHAKRLARLLNQVVNIALISAGHLTLTRQPTDLSALLAKVVAGQAVSDRHELRVTRPATAQIDADPVMLEQVLVNLLDNAVRYSPYGGAIDVTLNERDGGMVEIAVRDHGAGIAPELRGRIFERFFQAHAEDSLSGVGLGLYFCREITRLHGGDLVAEFPDDGGTRFVLRVPTTLDTAGESDTTP